MDADDDKSAAAAADDDLYAVLEHRASEHAGDAVVLHVSYSQSHGRERIAIVQREIEL